MVNINVLTSRVPNMLVISCRDRLNGTHYSHEFYTLLDHNTPLKKVYEISSTNSESQLIPLSMKDRNCFVNFVKYTTNLAINCFNINQNNEIEISMVNNLTINNIEKIVTFGLNVIAIKEIDQNEQLVFWQFTEPNQWILNGHIALTNTIIDFDIAILNDVIYAALCIFEPGFGGIKIYRYNFTN